MPAVRGCAFTRALPWAWYCALTVAVLGPLLLERGYVLTLDMIFVPRFQIQLQDFSSGSRLWSDLPVQLILAATTSILPGDILQKFVLVAITLGSMVSMHLSVRGVDQPARVFAASLYAFNPFTYERLLAGHWRLLLAYALTPLVLRWVFGALDSATPRQAVRAGGGWAALSLLSVHHALLFGLVLACTWLSYLLLSPHRIRTGMALIMIIVTWAALDSFWIIPLLAGHGSSLVRYDTSYLYAFATATDTRAGTGQNVLGLYGFWRERFEMDLTKEHLASWVVLYWLIMLPVVVGLASALTTTRWRREAVALLSMGAVGLFVSLGVSTQTYRVNIWVYEHVPGFGGLREPEKASALLALAYAWLGALGVSQLQVLPGRAAQAIRGVVLVALLALVVTYNSKMLWGGWGQLRPVEYPATWTVAQRVTSRSGGAMLSLPWKLYYRPTFVGRVIANPASDFFQSAVVSSQDMDMPGVDTRDRYPVARAVMSVLGSKDPKRWHNVLDAWDIRYVLVTRSRDAQDFDFFTEPGFTLVASDPDSALYEVR